MDVEVKGAGSEVLQEKFDQSLKALNDTYASLQILLDEVNAAKAAGEDVKVATLARKVGLLFVDLKRYNRLVNSALEQRKATTLQGKVALDGVNLQLQNLLYEKHNIKKEIEKCRRFRSTQPDVDLVSEDAFRTEAPAELTSAEDPHRLMLNRYSYELQQRETLRDEVAKLKKVRQQKAKQNQERTRFLDSLHGHLKTMLKATVPVQSHLSKGTKVPVVVHKLAGDLPTPLYILYCHFAAFGESLGGGVIETSILKEKNASKQASEPSAKRRRTDQADARMQSPRPNTPMSPVTTRADSPYTPHALKVTVTLSLDGGDVTFIFSYLVNLNIIAVATADTLVRDALVNLFPRDTGRESPNLANLALDNGTFTFSSAQEARPYRWAQYLGGLEFPIVDGEATEQSSNRRVQQGVQAVVAQLKARILSARSLNAQLASLSSCKIDLPSTSPFFPTTAVAELTKWSSRAVDTNRGLSDWRRYKLQQYRAVVSREKFMVTADIEITPEYPVRSPVFRLQCPDTVEHDNNLRDMETELNAHYGYFVDESTTHQTLSYQLRKLLQMVDICVDRAAGVGQGLGSVLRDVRGRGRTYPVASTDNGVDHR